MRPISLAICIVTLWSAWLVPVGRCEPPQVLVVAIDEWQQVTQIREAIAYEFRSETRTQVLSGTCTSDGRRTYIEGTALYKKNPIEDVGAQYAPVFTGRFAIYCNGKRVIRHLIDEWTRYESTELSLPGSVAVAPTNWIESPSMGNLPERFMRITSGGDSKISTTATSDSLKVVALADDGAHFDMIFNQAPSFHLASCLYEPSTAHRDQRHTIRCEYSWQEFGGKLVPMEIRDWLSNDQTLSKAPVRTVTLSGLRNASMSNLDEKVSVSKMPIGTLLISVENGVVKKKFAGGTSGEVENGLRHAAFKLRKERGEFTTTE